MWRAAEEAGVVHMCGFNYRFVPAMRLAREMVESGDARRDRPLPRPLPPVVGLGRAADVGASTSEAAAPARSATSARTSSTSAATSSGRSPRWARSCARSSRATRSTTLRRDGRVRGRRRRHARGVAARAPGGSTRTPSRSTGRAARRLRRGALRTSCSGGARALVRARPRHGARPSSWATGGRPATSSAGATPSRTSTRTSWRAIAGKGTVAPHGATFEDGYRAAEVCDAIVRSSESGQSGRRSSTDEDESRHLGVRPDGHALRARRLPAAVGRRDDRGQGEAGRRGARRPDRRLRVPLPAGALRRRTSTRCATRSAATTSTASRRGLHLDPRFGKRRPHARPTRDRGTRRRRRTLEAADFAGEVGAHFIIWPGIEGYNYPFQTPYPRPGSGSSTGSARRRSAAEEHGVDLFLEHKNSEPAMKILMRNIGMTLHVIHKLRAAGIDNVKVNMDWQHLIMNGENLARVRRDARRRGAARPPARELRLGDLRRRQHGRRDRVHGDARARASSSAVPGTATNGERLGFDLYPYTEDAVAAVRRVGAAVAVHRLGRGADRRCRAPARRSRGRTPCAPTSWCTPPWGPSEARPGADDGRRRGRGSIWPGVHLRGGRARRGRRRGDDRTGPRPTRA